MSKLNLDFDLHTDEDFFGQLRGRSNLGQLFGVDLQDDHVDDQSLKYQRTKAAKPLVAQTIPDGTSASTVADAQTWHTLLAKVVSAFKSGDLVGKVGLALLQNAQEDCKFILYKTKALVLATLTLRRASDGGGGQLYQQNRYLQFYDDDSIYWSILFGSEAEEKEFFSRLEVLNMPVQQQQQKQAQQVVSTEVVPVEAKGEVATDSNGKDEVPTEPFPLPTTAAAAGGGGGVKPAIHSKSTLISRMAKMGQQLPKFPGANDPASTEYSDSSDTEVLATPLASAKPTVTPRVQRLVAPLAAENSLSLYNNALSASGGGGGGGAIETQFMQMMLTDNRTQNTELRMNLNKLENKIERVLDKMDNLRGNGGPKETPTPQRHRDDEILELEEKLLELKKENRRLKVSLEGAGDGSQAVQNETQRCQQMTREVLKKHHQDLVNMIGLSSTNDLDTIMDNLIGKIQVLQNKLTANGRIVASREDDLSKNRQQLNEERSAHTNISQQAAALEEELKASQQQAADDKERCQQLEAELGVLQQRLEAAQQQAQLNAEEKIKAIMNSLYGSMVARLEELDETQIKRKTVLALLSQTVRDETLKSLAKP